MIALSVIAVVTSGFVGARADRHERLIAYSSISHMGLVTLGFFIFTPTVSRAPGADDLARLSFPPPCFLCAACSTTACTAADRRLRLCENNAESAADWMLSPWPTAACPRHSGFVGEFLVILGAMKTGFWLAFLALAP